MNLLALGLVLFGASVNLLEYPAFAALEHWRVDAGEAAISVVQMEGEPALRIAVDAEAAVGYPRAVQAFACAPGAVYEAVVAARGEDISNGFGVYMTIEFVDAEGRRLVYFQSNNTEAETGWTPLRVRGIAPPGAAEGRVCLLLNGRGTALFREPFLRLLRDPQPAPEAGQATLEVAARPLNAPFLGMGFEDDGWFFTPENAAKGVDAGAIALHEERIRFMQPDLVRMFFWYRDWNPSGDWETFTWDTPNMRSKYRALDLYQELGAAVNLTGVEWGMRAPFAQVEPMAEAIVGLLQHLVRDRGYTCVKYWTLTNEPNGTFLRTGASFEDYVRLHVLVKEGLQAHGLDVQVAGSDDTNGGFPWFTRCVRDEAYFNAVDLFASHRYLPKTGRELGEFFMRDRLELLGGRKPFIVAEFGFQDERSGTLENPLMREYDYALWAMALAIDGLNLGVSGFTVWCLNEVYYPNNWRMEYGLWDFADTDWRLRPVFHAWALLTRHTTPGQPVRPVTSSAPQALRAVVVGNALFWVSEAEAPLTLALHGAEARTMLVYNAELPLETLDPVQALPVCSDLVLPPRSFGVLLLQ